MNNRSSQIKLFLIFAFLYSPISAFAQQKNDSLSSQLNLDTSLHKFFNLYLCRPFKGCVKTTNLVINMLDVDSSETAKENLPGIAAPDSLSISITYFLINDAPLLNYDELMKTYNIPPKDQNLPVFIDSLLAYKPKQTYYELGDVQSVQVCMEKASGMKFISIITLFPLPKHYSGF